MKRTKQTMKKNLGAILAISLLLPITISGATRVRMRSQVQPAIGFRTFPPGILSAYFDVAPGFPPGNQPEIIQVLHNTTNQLSFTQLDFWVRDTSVDNGSMACTTTIRLQDTTTNAFVDMQTGFGGNGAGFAINPPFVVPAGDGVAILIQGSPNCLRQSGRGNISAQYTMP